ncbi:MAG: acetate--CoA ligase family protein [Candidatus Aminicenantes bacterium]|nr:acetate--CoA ligase family protein [Candidatus Aminicenantes bacterium]
MLDLLFRPRSVGIIGVSSEPLSIGRRILQNLLDHGYRGQIHLITPRAAAIGSFRTYPSILEVPGDVDLVNIAVRSALVPGVLEECGRKGVRFAVIHAAGFKEAGEEGRALEARILSIARAFGMRLCGPNSQGIQMSDPSFPVYANFTFVPMIPGNISILAQSGGVGETLKLHLFRAGLGLRIYASYGNESDLGLNEFLDHCGRDPGTRAIMLHIETLKDPAGFLDVASRISAIKPILALKTGRTPEGTRAAASHTGVLVEPDDLAEAVFDKSGVLSFRTQEEIIGAAAAFSVQRCPKGRRVAVLTNTGGPAVIAIDECVAAGLRPADLGPETRTALSRVLASEASLSNPVDVLATAGPEAFGAAMEVLLADPNVDSLLLVFVTAPFVDSAAISQRLADVAAASGKTVVSQVITLDPAGDVVRTLRGRNVPVYDYAETAARALAALTEYQMLAARNLALTVPQPGPPAGVADVLERYRGRDSLLFPTDAHRLLGLYGIAAVEPIPVRGRDGLASAAARAGFPLVLKAASPAIVHKTESEAVVLGLRDLGELEAAYDRMSGRWPCEETRFFVQRQVEGGREVIMGATANRGLAPTIAFGLGGIWVEALKDVRFKLAPLSPEEAADMIRSIQGFPVLAGFRGSDPVDLAALEDMLVRVAGMAAAIPEIREIDLNPVMALGEGLGAIVVDARIRVRSASAV